VRAESGSTSQAEEVEEGEEQENTSVSSAVLPGAGRELKHVSRIKSRRKRRPGGDQCLKRSPSRCRAPRRRKKICIHKLRESSKLIY